MSKLERYLLNHLKESNDAMKAIESYAEAERVPIMDKISIEFLLQLIRIKKPKKILEIGTAIGYSAIRMSDAYDDAHITTIERNDTMYNKAIENIRALNKSSQIDVILGDALDVLDQLTKANEKSYDFIFIDAAKGQYRRFFEYAGDLLEKDGVIISDNVLFQGLVYNEDQTNKRLANLASKVASYNKWLTELDEYTTSIVPIGDGVAITVKNQNKN